MMSKPRFLPRALLALLAGMAMPAFGLEYNMPVGVTEVSRQVHSLHMVIFWICVAIGVIVFGAMLVSMILHRKSRGHESATFHESTKLEIAWTIVPLIILIAMAVPSTAVLVKMYDSGGEDMVVEVRGYQWKWEYTYLDENLEEQVSFFSNLSTPRAQIENRADKGEFYLKEVDNPLVIPTDRKVRFLLTSNDVIHSWWVPDFGLKRDAIPGFINDIWAIVEEPGVYRGKCTELCGKDHGFMPVVVRALPPEEFDAWYAQQVGQEVAEAEAVQEEWTAEELFAKGEEVYNVHCVACHQADGSGMPPVFPAIAGSQVATGDVEAHMDIVYNGKPGTAMQAFGQQLDAAELASVMHYQRHAFGNDTDDVVTPQDVLAYAQAQ
ncbi:MAG: cytochrome c oxidase subunit II [Gammaproteobacteria bacterium]|nr:cytochrome c oxidase subunit II [Gammaproteobacteria bacterium]